MKLPTALLKKSYSSFPPLVPVIHSKTGTSASAPTVIAPKTSLVPAYETSSAPEELITHRKCRIYRPARTAMQSGVDQTRDWQIDFDVVDKWENPLIGYTSSADAVQALRIRFPEKEQAIQFAQKQGWTFVVQEDQLPIFKKKSYSDNFKYSAGPLRLVKTK